MTNNGTRLPEPQFEAVCCENKTYLPEYLSKSSFAAEFAAVCSLTFAVSGNVDLAIQKLKEAVAWKRVDCRGRKLVATAPATD